MDNWLYYLLQFATLFVSGLAAWTSHSVSVKVTRMQNESSQKIKEMELSYDQKRIAFENLQAECEKCRRGAASQKKMYFAAEKYLFYCFGKQREALLAFMEKASDDSASPEDIAQILIDVTMPPEQSKHKRQKAKRPE